MGQPLPRISFPSSNLPVNSLENTRLRERGTNEFKCHKARDLDAVHSGRHHPRAERQETDRYNGFYESPFLTTTLYSPCPGIQCRQLTRFFSGQAPTYSHISCSQVTHPMLKLLQLTNAIQGILLGTTTATPATPVPFLLSISHLPTVQEPQANSMGAHCPGLILVSLQHAAAQIMLWTWSASTLSRLWGIIPLPENPMPKISTSLRVGIKVSAPFYPHPVQQSGR